MFPHAKDCLLYLTLTLATRQGAGFMQEVAAPALQLVPRPPHLAARPGPPYTDQHAPVAAAGDRDKRKVGRSASFSASEPFRDTFSPRPQTLQQKLTKNSRKLDNHVFLPGFNTFNPSTVQFERFERPQRQVEPEVSAELDLEINDLFDLSTNAEGKDTKATTSTTAAPPPVTASKASEAVSPVVVTLSDMEPSLADLRIMETGDTSLHTQGSGSCSYQQVSEEQMALVTADQPQLCRKGGMRCERSCRAVTEAASEAAGECEEVLETVCEDVPEEVCLEVLERHCETVQEEVCQEEDTRTREVCTVEMDEECGEVLEQVCSEDTRVECTTNNKEICTTVQEEVCGPAPGTACREVETEQCSLVPDAVCRNITETRFDEKCWVEEEEDCRTVYDTVVEHKCEMVNITVPQRDCSTAAAPAQVRECRVVEEVVTKPVCVTIMDKEVIESCTELAAAGECYEERCGNVTRPVLSKQCTTVMEEQCTVTLDQVWEDQCTMVETTVTRSQCQEVTSEQCSDTQEWVCEDDELGLETLEYGAPQAPTITQSSQDIDESLDTFVAPKAPGQQQQQQHWRRKKSYDTSKHRAKVFVKKRLSRAEEEGEEQLRERRESAAEYETASEKVGAAFLEIGGAKFAANYFGRIPGQRGDLASTTPATFFNEQQAKALESTYKPSLTTTTRRPARKCYTAPRKQCEQVTRQECEEVPVKEAQEVCVPVKQSKPRQECVMKPRQECDIVESEESVRQCSVVAGPAAAPVTQCRSRVVEAPREVCADTEVTEARELCQEVTRMEEKITCDIHMKQIEIKELCVDISVQLPREECSSQEKKRCRYEPRQEAVQRCSPTVKEVCSTQLETRCEAECGESCEMRDKKVCMTLPQQECAEVAAPVCREVPRRECQLVPRERCTTEAVEERGTSSCAPSTRLECGDRPRMQCGTTFKSVCREEPRARCSDHVKQDCSMDCSPVYWCRVCSNRETDQHNNIFY